MILTFLLQLKLKVFLSDSKKHHHQLSEIPNLEKKLCFWICKLLWTSLGSKVLELRLWDSCTNFLICQEIPHLFQPFLDFSTPVWSNLKSNLRSIFHLLYAMYNFQASDFQETEIKIINKIKENNNELQVNSLHYFKNPRSNPIQFPIILVTSKVCIAA